MKTSEMAGNVTCSGRSFKLTSFCDRDVGRSTTGRRRANRTRAAHTAAHGAGEPTPNTLSIVLHVYVLATSIVLKIGNVVSTTVM